MSKVQTDNSFFDIKVKLRLENLPPKRVIRVLDCFAGSGLIWQRVQQLATSKKISVLGIDKKAVPGRVQLIGDNLKFLQAIDLDRFDAIDLDAYGIPYRQLQLILSRKFRNKVIIYATFIQSVFGCLPSILLADLGYTPAMVQKIPTLFYREGFDKFKQYLGQRGIQQIKHYSDSSNRKHYLCFEINGRRFKRQSG